MKDMLEWLENKSSPERRMRKLLREIAEWKANLDRKTWPGSEDKYSFLIGCLGNPNSQVVLVAEIPSLSTRADKCVETYAPELPDPRLQWKLSPGDVEFMRALSDSGLIPKTDNDNPPNWGVWITDFVKLPVKTKDWRRMKNSDARKRELLKVSASFLRRELDIIRPRILGTVGSSARYYMNTQPVGGWKYMPSVQIPHYSRKGNQEEMRNAILALGDWLRQNNILTIA